MGVIHKPLSAPLVGCMCPVGSSGDTCLEWSVCVCVCMCADRVAGLLEANNIYNVRLLVNRVRADMVQKNDMMSVKVHPM